MSVGNVKNNKSPGQDSVPAELLKLLLPITKEDETVRPIYLLNKYLFLYLLETKYNESIYLRGLLNNIDDLHPYYVDTSLL